MIKKNEYIDLIDDKLDLIYKNTTYEDYLRFIKGNSLLRQYDFILGRISIGKLSNLFMILLTKNKLKTILNYVSDEANRVKRLILL